MFGAVVRLAAAFAGSMLVASVLKEVINPHVLPVLSDTLGSSHLLYRSLDGVVTYLPLVVFLTAAVALVYRGIVERRLSGV